MYYFMTAEAVYSLVISAAPIGLVLPFSNGVTLPLVITDVTTTITSADVIECFSEGFPAPTLSLTCIGSSHTADVTGILHKL